MDKIMSITEVTVPHASSEQTVVHNLFSSPSPSVPAVTDGDGLANIVDKGVMQIATSAPSHEGISTLPSNQPADLSLGQPALPEIHAQKKPLMPEQPVEQPVEPVEQPVEQPVEPAELLHPGGQPITTLSLKQGKRKF